VAQRLGVQCNNITAECVFVLLFVLHGDSWPAGHT